MLPVNDLESLRQENSRLKRLLDEKEEELIQLREALRPADWMPPMEIGLSQYESRILGSLLKANGEVVTKERLLYALYYDKPSMAELKIVDVFVCKARKKLVVYGIEIKTHWGQGYYLDKPSIDILKSWGIDQNEAAAA